MPGVDVRASDFSYRAGVIEAYVPAASLAAVATKQGVRAVVPSSPMYTDVGIAQTKGRVLHRINKLPSGINGRGIAVGVMSDSYDANGERPNAADDILSGDLPGPGNPLGNSTPITVLEDGDFGSTPTKAARCCRSCTTSRRRRGSASRPRTAARSTSRTTSARSPASPMRRTRRPASPTSSWTT